ncbi:MAG: hypothetical protein ABEJ43_01210 [Haloferacaceae archaeon]
MIDQDRTDCPLCGETADDADGLRIHLMCEHRKSELTDVTLALLSEEPIPA